MDRSIEEEIGSLVLEAVRKAAQSQAAAAGRQTLSLGPGAPRQQATEAQEAVELKSGNYYLDEAGDSTIFGKRRRILVGQEGCSNFMMLGLLAVPRPGLLEQDMVQLRSDLLADPYFAGVPSLDPSQRKTARAFHAKDDLPEARREVFRLLLRHELSFSAVVCDKLTVLRDHIEPKQIDDPFYRFSANEQYDYQVRCLLKGRIHKLPIYNLHFASRGRSDRTESLKQALLRVQHEMTTDFGIRDIATLNVLVHRAADHAGLQAVDYFLWALQRLFERREDRYFNMLSSKVSVINDRTAKRDGRHGGTFFNRGRRLTLAAVEKTYGKIERDQKGI